MKIIEILNAKESIAKLNKIKFNDFSLVRKVYKLTKKLNEALDIVQEEQKKIIDLYAKKDENGNLDIKDNMYQFENDENKTKFITEFEKLKFSDVDDIEKVDIPLDAIESASDFTSEEMLKLEPFVNWID